MDIRYKVPNSYMMVKSWLITLLLKTQSTQITIQIFDLLLRIFHVLYFVLRYKTCGPAVAAGSVKVAATENCTVGILGYLVVPIRIWKCGFIVRIVLPNPYRNWAMVRLYLSCIVTFALTTQRILSVFAPNPCVTKFEKNKTLIKTLEFHAWKIYANSVNIQHTSRIARIYVIYVWRLHE